VEAEKKILIITDGIESTRELAGKIEAELKGRQALTLAAPDFSGSDILPADVFFLGCDRPNPPSFAYLEEILSHINLVGRPCGLFSPKSGDAIQYLSKIVKDSELSVGLKPLFDSDTAEIAGWVKNFIEADR
jgi:hypothetical protein